MSLVSELAGASSVVSAAVEPSKRTLRAEGRAARQGCSLAVGSHGFLGLRLPGMITSPEVFCSGEVGSWERWTEHTEALVLDLTS